MNLDKISDYCTSLSQARWSRTSGMFIGIFGVLYLMWKGYTLTGYDLSFKYIWLAGNLWSDGISPYSIQFQEIGQDLFTGFNGQPFYYPPNWWLFSTFLSQFDHPLAVEIWQLFNVSLIITSTLILNMAMRSAGIKLSWAYLFFYTGLVSFMQATAISLATGQTVIFIYFGLCLVIYGTLSQKHFILTLGFCILLLKPQIGVPLMAAFLPFEIYRRPVLYTIATTGLLCLPALITPNPIATTTAFLSGLSKHSEFASNSAQNSTGLKNILYTFSNVEVSGMYLILFTVISVFGVMVYIKKLLKENEGTGILSGRTDRTQQFVLLTMGICFLSFLSPLHDYDLIIVAPLILLCAVFGLGTQWQVSIIFLFLIRAENIAKLLGATSYNETRYYSSIISSIVVFCMLLTLIVAVKNILTRKEESASTQ